VIIHACNTNTWDARQETIKFEASLGYIAKTYLKKQNKTTTTKKTTGG
jgi:hypothetical protein